MFLWSSYKMKFSNKKSVFKQLWFQFFVLFLVQIFTYFHGNWKYSNFILSWKKQQRDLLAGDFWKSVAVSRFLSKPRVLFGPKAIYCFHYTLYSVSFQLQSVGKAIQPGREVHVPATCVSSLTSDFPSHYQSMSYQSFLLPWEN